MNAMNFEMTGHGGAAQMGQRRSAGRERTKGGSAPDRKASARINPADHVSSASKRKCVDGEGGAIHAPGANAYAPRPHEPFGPTAEGGEAVQRWADTQSARDRFADPLVAEIVETWRMRQAMVEAQRKLTLQAKALCRRFTAGDRTEADRLFAAVAKGGDHDLAALATMALMPLLAAQEPLVAQRKAFERSLTKMGKRLPIAHVADEIRGVSTMTLATIVGELGDLSAYEKGVAGIWKRAGLAVIDGERQRLVKGDAALVHGYAPARRAVFWNVGSALFKAQSGAEPGPYRLIYDARKSYEAERVETAAHAHNRAMRFMTKRLLKDLWIEWRAA